MFDRENPMKQPFVPANSPFNHDQQSWLAGFFAGLQSQMMGGADADSGEGVLTVNILFGTQTGNAESLAEDIAGKLGAAGMRPVLSGLDDVEMEALAAMDTVLIVTSTYGEGEMPDNAQLFWDALKSEDAPRMENMRYAVLALGDTGYDEFCEAGKQIDIRLGQLGAQHLHSRADCDVDYEDMANEWTDAVLVELDNLREALGLSADATAVEVAPKVDKSKWSRKNPFTAPVSVNRLLSGEGSAKEIRHYEIDLTDGPRYEAGDALGVIPFNDRALVEAWLERLNLSHDTAVPGFEGSLGELMHSHFEISTPSTTFMKAVAERAKDEHLTHILEHGDKEALEAFLWNHDALDYLLIYPHVNFTVAELSQVLKPLQHRAYSISSSSKLTPDSVHLTIASVRYKSNDRMHGGVASTYLADRVGDGGSAKVFVSPNKSFRVPEDDSVPMVMVGPGTGIAPFRAFLQERQATGAKGMNWLFFGDQHAASDFIYRDELEDMQKAGVLSRLDLAFSRDQEAKIYVQNRMVEHGKDLFAALEDGGHFYVCGDATRMAKDVDRTLHEIIAREGGMSEDSAVDYVNAMKKSKRYVRDVY